MDMPATPRTRYERALAATIEEARIDLGWSQQVLSARASAHLDGGRLEQTTLSRMIRGTVPMRVDYVGAIAAAFGMSMSALCRLAEGREPELTRAMPVRPEPEPSPSAGRRRTPRRATGLHLGA